jgi:hypothetical protein
VVPYVLIFWIYGLSKKKTGEISENRPENNSEKGGISQSFNAGHAEFFSQSTLR